MTIIGAGHTVFDVFSRTMEYTQVSLTIIRIKELPE